MRQALQGISILVQNYSPEQAETLNPMFEKLQRLGAQLALDNAHCKGEKEKKALLAIATKIGALSGKSRPSTRRTQNSLVLDCSQEEREDRLTACKEFSIPHLGVRQFGQFVDNPESRLHGMLRYALEEKPADEGIFTTFRLPIRSCFWEAIYWSGQEQGQRVCFEGAYGFGVGDTLFDYEYDPADNTTEKAQPPPWEARLQQINFGVQVIAGTAGSELMTLHLATLEPEPGRSALRYTSLISTTQKDFLQFLKTLDFSLFVSVKPLEGSPWGSPIRTARAATSDQQGGSPR